MRAQPHVGHELAQLLAIEGEYLSRLAARRHCVENDKRIPADEVIDEVQTRRANVHQLNLSAELILRFQTRDGVRTKAVVLEQNVAHTGDKNSWSHRTFTDAIFFPSGSKVWHAQAMQGSKECTVRKTSSGFSGSAMGLPSSDISYGPGCPRLSRVLAFHVVGTTAW